MDSDEPESKFEMSQESSRSDNEGKNFDALTYVTNFDIFVYLFNVIDLIQLFSSIKSVF